MKLASRTPAGADREALARQAVEAACPLPFAFECVRWFRKGDDTPETERVISAECEDELGRILAERIRVTAAEGPLYRVFGSDTPRLLWVWSKWGQPGAATGYLREQLEQAPNDIEGFWGTFVGPSRKADLSREAYDTIAKLVDADHVMAKLRAKYGVELDAPQYHLGNDEPYDRRLAHQFAAIHKHVQGEGHRIEPPETAENGPSGDGHSDEEIGGA
jgi:hypothetical protein